MTRRAKLLWIMIVVSLGLIAAIVWDHFDRTNIPDSNTLVQFFQDTAVTGPDGRLTPVTRWAPEASRPQVTISQVIPPAASNAISDVHSADQMVASWLPGIRALTGLQLVQSPDQDGDIIVEFNGDTSGPAVHNSMIVEDQRITSAVISVRIGDLLARQMENCDSEREDCISPHTVSQEISARILKGLVRTLGLQGSPRDGRSILRNDSAMTASDALALHILYLPEMRPGTSAVAAIDYVRTHADSLRASQAVQDFLGTGNGQ